MNDEDLQAHVFGNMKDLYGCMTRVKDNYAVLDVEFPDGVEPMFTPLLAKLETMKGNFPK